MIPADLLPSRAHRRFLRQLQPVRASRDEDYFPVTQLTLALPLRSVLDRHLATAGQPRGGVLLGTQREGNLQVTHLLPAGYPPFLNTVDPLALDPAYVLGAVDAARQSAPLPLDWIGSWVMPAAGLTPPPEWCLQTFRRARRQALVSAEQPLLVIGRGEDTTSLQAVICEPGTGHPAFLPVSWERPQGGEL